MRKFKVFTVIAVMALISSGMFNACQKGEVLTSNISEKTLNIKKNSTNYYNDEVLGRTAPIGDWDYFRNIGHQFRDQGMQVYLALSMDYSSGYLRYGFITEDNNADVYHYITDRFAWILNGEEIEEDSEIEVREFNEIENAMDLVQTKLQENRDITMFQLENDRFVVVVEQNHFVLMTESERQYLIANGESTTIDDFKLHAVEIITSKVGQFLVTTVENGNVYFMGISVTGNQASWYNRLHEHFISHPPMVDPDEPRPDGCTAWTDITDEEGMEMFNEKYKLLMEMGLDIVTDAYTDGEGNIWIWACNGTCVC